MEQGNLEKNKHFFGFFNFFRNFPEFLDPKCYTWLESYGSEDSHGKKLKKFGVTIWLTEFCQHFEIQIITPADTLSWLVSLIDTIDRKHTFHQTTK